MGSSFIFPQVIKDKRCQSRPVEELEQEGPEQLMSTILQCGLWRMEGNGTSTALSSVRTRLSSLPSLVGQCSDCNFNQKFDASNLDTIIVKSLEGKKKKEGVKLQV